LHELSINYNRNRSSHQICVNVPVMGWNVISYKLETIQMRHHVLLNRAAQLCKLWTQWTQRAAVDFIDSSDQLSCSSGRGKC
jgi:hypothetical protein